jgi:hypothetical protein
MGEENQGCGEDAAFRHAEKKAQEQELAIGASESATDRE